MFAAPVYAEELSGRRTMIPADFNRDGRADLAVSHGIADGRPSDEVWLGDGRGGFSARPLPLRSTGLATGDIDGDGDPDIVATMRTRDRFAVLLGDGQGSFAEPRIQISAGWVPEHVTLADVDRDGDPDVVLGHGGSDDVTVFTNDGHGVLAFHSRTLLPSLTLHQLLADDVDRDGAPDILVVQTWNPATRSRVYALRNDGSGHFAAPRELRGVPEGIERVELADTDGDGHPDLVVGARSDLAVSRGDGRGGFGDPTELDLPCDLDTTLSCWTGPLLLADLDGDRRADLVTTHGRHGGLVVLTAAPRSGFGRPQSLPGAAGEAWPQTFADVDGDCAPDLLVATHRGLATYLNNRQMACPAASRPIPAAPLGVADPLRPAVAEPAALTVPRRRPEAGNRELVRAADVTADGLVDLLHVSGRRIVLRTGAGAGGFGPPRTVLTAAGPPGGLAVGDVDGDGRPDVVTRTGRSLSVLTGDARGGLRTTQTSPAPPAAAVAGLADMDGDGALDAVVHIDAKDREAIAVFRGDGNAGFAVLASTPSADLYRLRPAAPALADLDGDGDIDIARATGTRIAVHTNDGHGRLSAAGFLEAAPTGRTRHSNLQGELAAADLDADGRADLVVAQPGAGSVAVLRGVGTGGFTGPQWVPTGGAQPTAVAVADVTGDGAPDLLVANHFSHEFVVLAGDGRGSFRPPVHAVTAGLWPVALEVADVDGDGAPDVVADNAYSGLVSVHRNTGVLARTTAAVRP